MGLSPKVWQFLFFLSLCCIDGDCLKSVKNPGIFVACRMIFPLWVKWLLVNPKPREMLGLAVWLDSWLTCSFVVARRPSLNHQDFTLVSAVSCVCIGSGMKIMERFLFYQEISTVKNCGLAKRESIARRQHSSICARNVCAEGSSSRWNPRFIWVPFLSPQAGTAELYNLPCLMAVRPLSGQCNYSCSVVVSADQR